ncbi:MAG TPA: asparagine synthase (glutamine-hydrolyzing) [Phycisphaerae bacterium]|nr:asparagine synthase (glutamine-hydrolyzing) [Phycisphaerae bacterium]
MCGIAGVVKWTAAAESDPWNEPAMAEGLQRMSEALAHRGPDGRGEFVDQRPGKVAALVHRRLAVIDLPCGAQPMGNEDGRVQVVFNGEIYNHADLRADLTRAGHRFATDHSDTEVLVHGWEEWGEELPGKLVGMFAFAVWDFRGGGDGRARDTLFLARDRLGQKPLFYASLEDGVVFGSTIPSVLAWPEVPRRLPREQIGLFLLLGYFPAPQTAWRDVHQVLPGAWVRLRGEVLDGKRYWTPMDEVQAEERAAEREDDRARGELRRLMEEAVRSQLVADVPVACFLSGGIDSSIVAALMQAAAQREGRASIRTVSVGFAEAAFDETVFAEQVARKIGSVHTRLEVSPDGDLLGDLAALMRTGLGQPFADSSLLPTYQLSKAVRSIAPVALSGDGADELFGGYDRYRAMTMLARWSPLSRFVPRTMPLGSLAKRERYRRLAAAARAGITSERYTRLVEIFFPEAIEELLGEPVLDYFPLPEEYGLADDVPAAKLARVRDQQEYLPGDVLWKVDTAAMQVALEVRSPFLDHRVARFANGLPEEALFAGARGKRILREAFAADLPAEVRMRGKKGFAVPVGAWFRGKLREPLRERLLGAGSFVRRQLRKAAVERLLKEHASLNRDHTHRLFALLMLELFAEAFGPAVE